MANSSASVQYGTHFKSWVTKKRFSLSFPYPTMPRFDYTAAIEELQTLRTTNERRSEHVAAVGARLIREKHMAKLKDQGTRPFHIATRTLPI